eukprot:1166437-Prymnesium_polylepis.1
MFACSEKLRCPPRHHVSARLAKGVDLGARLSCRHATTELSLAVRMKRARAPERRRPLQKQKKPEQKKRPRNKWPEQQQQPRHRQQQLPPPQQRPEPVPQPVWSHDEMDTMAALEGRGVVARKVLYHSDVVVVHEVVFVAGGGGGGGCESVEAEAEPRKGCDVKAPAKSNTLTTAAFAAAAREAGFELRRGRWTRCVRANPDVAPSLCELLRSGWVRGWTKRAQTTATGGKMVDHLALLDGAGSVDANRDVLKEARKQHGVRFLRGEWLAPLDACGGELREAHERGSAALQPEALRLLARVEETVRAPVERWPAHLRTAAFAPRLGYRADKYDSGVGRRALACFLLHNGCPADAMVDWLAARDGCVRADAWTEFRHTISAAAAGRARDQVLTSGAAAVRPACAR